MALYDPGANITIVEYEFFKKLNVEMFTSKNLRYNTMAGEDKILGSAFVSLKIFEEEKKMRVFVVKKESFRYDFLLGLDTIYEFALEQDCKGNISQAREKNNNNNKSEIKSKTKIK